MAHPAGDVTDAEVLEMSSAQIDERVQQLDEEIRIMRDEMRKIAYNIKTLGTKTKENNKQMKKYMKMPWQVANVVEILDLADDQAEGVEEGSSSDLDALQKRGAVIKISKGLVMFLPRIGLVSPDELKPGDLIGVNDDTFHIIAKLPPHFDRRVKAMEVVEKPTETYSEIGGCETQIKELKEAIVLPMTKKELFIKIGIHPPKGVLMYGPPGTGKTLLARAVASQTQATFLRLSGTLLNQVGLGDGAKMVQNAFELTKQKAPAIIFIDELDAIGTKRFDASDTGDRDIQRTMLELLNQLDVFQPNDDIKVIAATNRVDVLDPALLRSGRFDRKIEFPAPNEKGREQILRIHSRRMNVDKNVNFVELSRCIEDFNGAQCRAVCVEAGMVALRRDSTKILHEDFMDGILEDVTAVFIQFDPLHGDSKSLQWGITFFAWRILASSHSATSACHKPKMQVKVKMLSDGCRPQFVANLHDGRQVVFKTDGFQLPDLLICLNRLLGLPAVGLRGEPDEALQQRIPEAQMEAHFRALAKKRKPIDFLS
ncbi:hypothetical protein niasHT_005754 [Heterodera trifolii]|uniref:AAA+ ATPase domain-containing protein n=1 Tax=Heterodera trifolii TaxID=157864 RepID=A0ABD2M3F6_9BILA